MKKATLGRNDKADFPDLGLEDIDIKMDTGAFTSAIHCREITTETTDGKERLTFTLLDPSHPQYADKKFTFDSYSEKQIKNSFGGSERRFVIETTIHLFGETYPILLSLSDRGEMRFPILIGRKFLMKKFVVDPARTNLSYRKKTKTSVKK